MILGCRAFAHRGLWSPEGPPENSIAAFRAAADAGVGIELDVQLSSDSVPVVFHDPMLDRMTSGTGAVWHHSAEDLTALTLAGSNEPIPTLTEVLRALPVGLPVLVELKASPGDPAAYVRALEMAAFGARAAIAVMSFVNPLNAALQAAALPYPRGVLIAPSAFDKAETADVVAAATTFAPDYVAPWHAHAPEVRAEIDEQLALAAWTIDSEADLATAKAAGAAIIFEHLDPALVIDG